MMTREQLRTIFDLIDRERFLREHPGLINCYEAMKAVLTKVYEDRFESFCAGYEYRDDEMTKAMTARPRKARETAAERDEWIIIEAGPWRNLSAGLYPHVEGRMVGIGGHIIDRLRVAKQRADALCRHLNRLHSKSRARRGRA